MILSTHGVIASQIQSFVGLLDAYPNAAVAYSVRKLKAAYTGNAIRVRRSSDNTEQNIGFTALGNLDTSALTTFCSGTNGFVTTWYDQSGNANNATQTTAANQPQIVSSGAVLTLNSKPALNWNGTNYWLTTAQFSPEITQPATYFITAQSNTGSSNALFDGFTNAKILYYRNGTNFSFNGPSALVETTAAATTQLLYTNLANGASSAFFNNGVSKASGNAGTNNIDGIVIGNLGSGFTAAGFQLRGNYQELVLYPSNQTSNQTAIESNINTYYAIY